MKVNTLHDLFLMLLKDTYSAENQLVEALPKMAEGASDPELKQGFEQHLEQTKEHVSRLEEVGEKLRMDELKGVRCHGMEGLISEGDELLKQKDTPAEVIDAGLISAAQKVEHYEIVTYATLISWAKVMGHDNVIEPLQATLDEEKETDEKLNTAAEKVNQMANEAAGME